MSANYLPLEFFGLIYEGLMEAGWEDGISNDRLALVANLDFEKGGGESASSYLNGYFKPNSIAAWGYGHRGRPYLRPLR